MTSLEAPTLEGFFVVAVIIAVECATPSRAAAPLAAALAFSARRVVCDCLRAWTDRLAFALPRQLTLAFFRGALPPQATSTYTPPAFVDATYPLSSHAKDALIVPTGAFLGSLAGGLVGALAGMPPAIFTFGLSVPLGGALGSAAGTVIGVSVATTAWLQTARRK